MNITSIGSNWGGISSYAMQRAPAEHGNSISSADFASLAIQQKDQNGDGAIGANESGLASPLFDKLDLDSDGLLSSSELQTTYENRLGSAQRSQQGPPPPPPDSTEMASQIIAREDSNGDGVISADEASIDSTRFNQLDSNGDGTISLEELQNSAKDSQPEDKLAGAQNGHLDFASVVENLNKNDASKAYSNQDWLNGMLESLAKQISVSA